MQCDAYQQAVVLDWLPPALLISAMVLMGIVISEFNAHLVFHLTLFASGLVTVWIIAPAGEKRAFVAIYVIGYVLRLLAIVLVHQISLSGLIFADDRGYDEQARYLASDWSLSNLNFASAELGTTHTGYPILLSTLYAFLGPSVFSAKVLSALFGALTAPVAFFLAAEVTGEQRTGRLAA